ncbi:hypothetical protein IFM89_014489 [Coptis chinensis]|uniref:SAM-dependent MTase DRM-type domain-containing protein n=1 Tax=Coptis chinensis TaxID=261450 RepID=A0A835HD64_9MAGN|nr:hypothetical protein IFM89_014489 [Coptis chinensis]
MEVKGLPSMECAILGSKRDGYRVWAFFPNTNTKTTTTSSDEGEQDATDKTDVFSVIPTCAFSQSSSRGDCSTLQVGPLLLPPKQLSLFKHTQLVGADPIEKLRSLKYSFQTNTLGYHLSVLKWLFPDGLSVLSLFSGIGGAEVALHRLGLLLKGVVSMELCETNWRILRKWWQCKWTNRGVGAD